MDFVGGKFFPLAKPSICKGELAIMKTYENLEIKIAAMAESDVIRTSQYDNVEDLPEFPEFPEFFQ